MVSDNISQDFFKDEASFEDEEKRNDGKVVIKQKGSVRILEEWLTQFFSAKDPRPVKEIFTAFKKVRKLRQKPAHKVEDNTFEQKYLQQQREIMTEVYSAIRTLRLIFASHPDVRDYEIPEWLKNSKIWLY